MVEIEVKVASPGERGVLANLLQLYTHDFSEFWAGAPDGELEDDGRFGPYRPLESYWLEADRVPLLFRRNARLIGFALVNAVSHIGAAVERDMAEFFIVRKHRRGGVGTAAARAVFSLYPGAWEVAVARRNPGALTFWRQAIAGHASVSDVRELDVTSPTWDGQVFLFQVSPA